jgi:glycosyltransferase involved in cell wall biosynthesis
MRVIISVPGRFHLFNLAQQLLRRDFLAQLITSYPKFEVQKYGIPRELITSVVVKELLYRSWEKLPAFLRESFNPQFFIHRLFDELACRSLRRADIVVGGSSVFLETLRRAHAEGALTVVERGSSHIAFQRDILVEEYERNGLRPVRSQLPHPRVIERELCEYEETDYISIPSLFVRRTFSLRGVSESKLIHVPYGVDLSSFRQVEKTDGVFRVVFAGGMCLRKGVHYLLKAFAELHLPNAELLLVGAMNDEMRPFFERYAGSYRYIGKVPQAELYTHYSRGSVFVLMSVEEGLAMVVPQAMACGLPVIATTNTGAEDIVRDGADGFIIPIRDEEKLKEKLTFLYEHPDARAAMGRSAKERVSIGFTWDEYGSRMVDAYTRILSSRTR